MEFQHIGYEKGTGAVSKEIETYNFHKAAGVLAEYGFDCIRLSNDWKGADFLAHHNSKGKTLQVQLKTCLVIDKDYADDLYMCFPLDGTDGTWYLVKHSELVDIVKKHADDWFAKYEAKGGFWHWTAKYRRGRSVLEALEQFAYRPWYRDLGYKEARIFKKKGLEYAKVEKTKISL